MTALFIVIAKQTCKITLSRSYRSVIDSQVNYEGVWLNEEKKFFEDSQDVAGLVRLGLRLCPGGNNFNIG